MISKRKNRIIVTSITGFAVLIFIATGYLFAGPYIFEAIFSFDNPAFSLVSMAIIVSPLAFWYFAKKRGRS